MVDVLSNSENGRDEYDRELRRVVAPPPFSKFLRNVLIVFGSLVVLAVVLVVVRQTKYSPNAAVDGYLSALEDRDTSAAFARLDQSAQQTGAPLLQAPVVRDNGYSPPTNHKITAVVTDGDASTVTVSLTIGGAANTMNFHLVRDSASLSKVFRPWRITDGLGYLSVTWPYDTSVIVAEQRITVEQGGHVETAAFPGTYTVSNDSAVLDSTPITVAVNNGNQPSAAFAVSLKKSALTDVQTQIESMLAGCAAKTTLQLTDCPFTVSTLPSGTASNIVWAITAMPVYQVGIQPNYVAVTTNQQGTGRLTYSITDTGGKSRDTAPQNFSFNVDGYISSDQGKAIYHMSREN